MGNGFQFIDIILFAMIAAFLILRLRSVLGRRDGHEGGYADPFKREASDEAGSDNVVQLPDRRDDDYDAPLNGDELGAEEVIADDALAAGVTQVRRHDPSFNMEDFLVGARVAFEMILGSYASGDRETLENLLSPEVLANFIKAIDDREAAGHTMEDTLVGIRHADIVEAFMEDEVANVTVKFVSEQVNVTRDGQGHVIDGSPNQVADVVDFWTFARDTRSGDPNWILVATRSLD
ncbi:MAG: Tim44/TimA family putative adaptor protein [Magnetovibrio sp.]|nr:Tim44/TimA family putative adaptor protein [Magnetovibrio sp.]